jgi:hypothetical protein
MMTLVALLLVAIVALLAWAAFQAKARDAALMAVLHDLRTLQLKELELRVARGQLRAGEGAARLRERIAAREGK